MKVYLILTVVMLVFASVSTGRDIKNDMERWGNRITWAWAAIGTALLLILWNDLPILL